MANLHLLANRTSLVRLRNIDSLVAASTDGSDARADALRRLERERLGRQRTWFSDRAGAVARLRAAIER